MNDIGASGAIPRSDMVRMDAHAERYYDAIRSRSSDVMAIAENTGFAVEDVAAIKQHIFIDAHDLGGVQPMRFAPDYDMAVSWQRLIDGRNIQEMDIVLLHHELAELRLMAQGLDYRTAHLQADMQYSYTGFVRLLNATEGIL